MNGQWYYIQGSENAGPIPFEQLLHLIRDGHLNENDLVWQDGTSPQTIREHNFDRFLEESNVLSYVPTQSKTPLPKRSIGSVQFVGLWWRGLAYLIDYAICVFPIKTTEIWAKSLLKSGSLNANLSYSLTMTFIAVVVITHWLYCAFMESSSRQATIGKLICGFIVVDEFGNRISFGRASGRFFAKFLSAIGLYIGFLMIGMTDRCQGWHDSLAGTVVIRKNASIKSK